jgi:hypothetical protein
MGVDIHRDVVAQHLAERGSRCFRGPGNGRRTAWPNIAGEHRVDRSQRPAPHRREGTRVTTAIHIVFPSGCASNIVPHRTALFHSIVNSVTRSKHSRAAVTAKTMNSKRRRCYHCGNISTGFIAAPEVASAAARLMSAKS